MAWPRGACECVAAAIPPSCARVHHCSTKKELASYQKEADKQSDKVSKMESSGADEYDIRKQVRHPLWSTHEVCLGHRSRNSQKEVLEESVQMVADSKRRLADAVENLRGLIVRWPACCMWLCVDHGVV